MARRKDSPIFTFEECINCQVEMEVIGVNEYGMVYQCPECRCTSGSSAYIQRGDR